MTGIHHVPADTIDELACANEAKIYSLGGIHYFRVTNPKTGEVTRIVGSRPSIRETAARKAAAVIAEVHAETGYVPQQRSAS